MFAINILTLFVAMSALGNVVSFGHKIHPDLEATYQLETKANIFVTMEEGTEQILELVSKKRFISREIRINEVVDTLQTHADRTQKSVKNFLKSNHVSYQSFWISNQIYIKDASETLARELANIPEVGTVTLEGISHIEAPVIHSIEKGPESGVDETQWGVSKIEADRVWSTAGNVGTGVVVGIIDTGARWTHRDLMVNYRTPYGWRDPSLTHLNATANDNNGHGTHCLGTIIGSNGIGVAPGAKWIACKGCTSAFCLNSDLIICGQFMTCPTLPDGSNQDCSKAPHLVSNSWAGGQGNSFYNPVVNAWKVARIVPIFGLGNSGPNCNTALSPADSDVIGVGATNSDDNLAEFSSKGPSIYGTLKPEISAPGQNIYSAHNSGDDKYATMSGTSMATPHVAGAVALIMSKMMGANLTYEQVKDILFTGADTSVLRVCSSQCGGIGGRTYPNNCYGHGRLNVFKSLQNLK